MFLYRLCRRLASASAAFFTTLYVAGLFPAFWCYSYFHPSDPIGVLISIGLTELLLDEELKLTPYYLLLLLAGFFWEKNLLLPLSVGIYQFFYLKKKLFPDVARIVFISTLAACFGQIFLRLLFYGPHPWDSISLKMNIETLGAFFTFFPIVYGPAILGLFLNRKCPPLFKTLLMQWPIWFIIYISFGGWLREMRAFLVMMAYAAPLMAMWFDQLIGKESIWEK